MSYTLVLHGRYLIYLNFIIPFSGDRDVDLDRSRERESIFRIRERRRLDTTLREEAMKALDRGKTDSLDADGLKKQRPPTDSPLNFGEDLQFFIERVIHRNKIKS